MRARQGDVDAERCEHIGGDRHSGGGKSTLLRIIAGLEHPDEGAVIIDGEPVKFDEASLQRYRRTIGTVFQTFNLFPHLDALGNITLPLKSVRLYL